MGAESFQQGVVFSKMDLKKWLKSLQKPPEFTHFLIAQAQMVVLYRADGDILTNSSTPSIWGENGSI